MFRPSERMRNYGELHSDRSDSETGPLQGGEEDPARGVLHLGPPHLPGLRVGAGDEDDGQGRWPADHRARQHGLHVRGEHHVLQHVVGGSLDAHATGQQRIGRAGHRRGSEGADAQGQDEEGADQRHRVLRRWRRRRHGRRRNLRDADACRLQLPDPDVRQRVVRQHRHPAFGQHAVGREHHVQPARPSEANHASPLEEEHGRHDGGGPSRVAGTSRPFACLTAWRE